MFYKIVLAILIICFKALRVECICRGQTAQSTEFIFRAAIAQGSMCSWNYLICGGTLIAKRCVLTAAHCIYKKSVKELKVIVGGIRQDGTDGVVYSIRKLKIHRNYTKSKINYDIGIAVLAYDVQLMNDRIGIALLPEERILHELSYSTFGWGRIDIVNYDSVYPEELQKLTDLTVLDTGLCMSLLPSRCLFNSGLFNSGLICFTGTNEQGSDEGDSGSGVIANENIVIGIVFGGFNECGKHPTFMIPVFDHLDWINGVINSVSECNNNRCTIM